jgi:DNA-directed RNA polymerase subunit RPC12/RpoP
LALARRFFSQNKRNRDIDIIKLCRCLKCGKDDLTMAGEKVVCHNCGKEFMINNGIIDFT